MKAFRIILNTSDNPVLVIAKDITKAIEYIQNNKSNGVDIERIEVLKEYTSSAIIIASE